MFPHTLTFATGNGTEDQSFFQAASGADPADTSPFVHTPPVPTICNSCTELPTITFLLKMTHSGWNEYFLLGQILKNKTNQNNLGETTASAVALHYTVK